MAKVFIDGSAGTTGLKIYDRLSQRSDINLITLPNELRKDINARKDAINNADIVFLCLPDAAAIEAVSLLENKNTRIIDTSTAHRTNENWAYGFAELKGYREKIKNARLVANPGCHASGFIALINPLTENKIINNDAFLSCFSITGYSGGGKKMIAEYEDENKSELLLAPRQYALSQSHKHLKEMQAVCSLNNAPSFSPIVAPFYSGMEVSITLFKDQIKGTKEDIIDIYKSLYTGKIIHFNENNDEEGFLSACAYSGFDDMEISVYGNDERILLTARYDNLGKGASGAAVQNMNILLGTSEEEGLIIK